MKTLITRVRNLLVLQLCAAPLLIWAISPSIQGLSVTTVPQLKFAQVQIQRLATNLTPFTQKATSPYSKGAISYTSTQPDVASVNASTGEVTPKKVGETRIVATQQAATPFPAATAEYKVQLTGEVPVFDSWTLGSKTYVQGAAYTIGVDLPAAQARNSTGTVISGTITYRLKDPAMATIATVTPSPPDNSGNVTTTVTPLKTGTITLVAELAATAQFAAGSTEATLTISALPTMNPVTLPYGANLTLTAQATGVTSAVTGYRVADNTIATVSPSGQINTVGAGSTTLFAVLNGVDVASGPLTITPGTPTLTNFSAMTRSVSDEPFDLDAKSVDLVTGAPRTTTVRYAVTTSSNPQAVTLLGTRGQTVWIAQGGTVEITATQEADKNHVEVNAKATLTIGGAGLPWVKVTQALPDRLEINREYTIKVRTNSPMRLALGMKNRDNGEWLNRDGNPYWKYLSESSSRGPNIEDEYVVKFDNRDTADVRLQYLVTPPEESWEFPGFITPLPFPTEWSLGNTTLSRVTAGPDAPFPGRPTGYSFTFGTTPSAADAAIPSEVTVDDGSVQTSITELVLDNPTSQNPTYYLKPVGVGSYTLKGTVKSTVQGVTTTYNTSVLVTVSPAKTDLSALDAVTLTMDVKRVQVFLPGSSRPSIPGTPDKPITFTISPSGVANLVTEGGKYYIEPVALGTTRLIATQEASDNGNYAKGTVDAEIKVTAGKEAYTSFSDVIADYGDRDVDVPLPTEGFNPDLPVVFTVTNIAPLNPKGSAVLSATKNGSYVQIGFGHAGVAKLVATQGTSTANITITVNKIKPSLIYSSAVSTQLQRLDCAYDVVPVWMPRLNEGPRTSAPGGGVVVSTAELSSASDGVITYSIGNPFLLSFGTLFGGASTTYDHGSLYGAQPGRNPQSVPYSLTVNQAESADYLPAAPVTVPNAFSIRGVPYTTSCNS